MPGDAHRRLGVLQGGGVIHGMAGRAQVVDDRLCKVCLVLDHQKSHANSPLHR